MEVYLVGGAVRDKLLGIEPHEYDWVVVGATPAELEQQGYQQVGKDFPVFLHPKTKDEYALARTERKSGQGYTGFAVAFGPEVRLEDDLIRRDLTINAIAEDADGQLIDPYHGQRDIEQQLLRHVSPAFTEDPLRVLRIARFYARFAHLGFTIATDTWDLLKRMVASKELEHLTPERVWLEWEKSLHSNTPELFLKTLRELGALPQVFPALSVTDTQLEHIRLVAGQVNDSCDDSCDAAELRFAATFIALANDENHAFDLTKFCRDFAIPNRFKECAQLAQQEATAIQQPQLSSAECFQLLQRIDYWRRPERLAKFLALRKALLGDSELTEQLLNWFADILRKAAQDAKAINAQALVQQGLTGKAIGTALQQQRQQIIEQAFKQANLE